MRVSLYALSGLSVFLGAFLLFVVQPIAGKQLLPHFGGSSSTWTTSLVFFTTALFLGYLYVYVLTRFPRVHQSLIHIAVVGATILFTLVFSFSPDDAPVLLEQESMPIFSVLSALFLSIGMPYFLLATTGPLMQYWYGTSGKKPYTLYALSNAASLLALLSYPFVIEPMISLRHQEEIWTILFIAYALVSVTAALTFRTRTTLSAIPDRLESPLFWERLLWIALAALPSFALVATTTQITQAITSVPLLWIAPLALYLVTFIVAFRGWGRSVFVPLFFFVSACVAWWFTPASYYHIVPQILSYLALLFFCGLSCHALLYRMRPESGLSPLFYLHLSLGGALGALLSAVLAPLVFPDYWEFPLALALSGAFAMWILPTSFFPRIMKARHVLTAKILFAVLAATLFAQLIFADNGVPTIATRNFYGNAQVTFGEDSVSLIHGTTLHGAQFTDPANARLPTTYYTPGSGIGRAILFAEGDRGGKGVRVGVIGLGTGSVAAYCRPGDTYTFYEIDARIETIARSYFSYLSRCKGADVRIGDGRLLLAAESLGGTPGAYDVLAVDAFSDDVIPVHLLTLHALEIYVAHLRAPESILAIHISNRYLDLGPVVFRLAAELGFNAMLVSDSGETGAGGTPSAWVVLSKDSDVLQSTVFANTNSIPPGASARVWTDDYSSLLPALNLPKPWD